MFGTSGMSNEEIRARLLLKKSSLDALIGNAKRLNNQISAADRNRIDEYFTTIRSIENRLTKAEEWINEPYPDAPSPPPRTVGGRAELELTFDLMVTALQSDSSRVLTYMMPTQAILKHLKSKLNPHKMSHFGPGKPDTQEIQKQRDLIFSKLVTDFLKKLKAPKEHNGSSILDHSLVAYGSCLRKNHNLNYGPMILAGHGGGGLKQGQNLVYKSNSTPLSNLWLSMIRHVGAKDEQFSDSSGVLSEIGFKYPLTDEVIFPYFKSDSK